MAQFFLAQLSSLVINLKHLQQLVEAEKAIAPFREQLEKYSQEFGQKLANKYVLKTVKKHTNIVD